VETQLLSEKYADALDGVLNCCDRIIVTGHLSSLCYAKGMTRYLYTQNIRIFDYTQFAKPLSDQIRANAEALAQANGLEIEFIRKKNFRKEERIQAILEKRGTQPGLVHIFSAMERCHAYKPWYDKATRKTYVKRESGKCLHYYFYFIDDELGLCYVRVPTWCPFRLQVYFNGHAWLAGQLKQHGIPFEMLENAFTHIADYDLANQLAAQFDIERLRVKLDSFAQCYCPVVQTLSLSYQWSMMQIEYATDLVFKRQADLQAFYPHLLETLIHAVKPADIATFLGRKLHGNYQGEMGNRFNVRLQGTRIKHQMGSASIKMYDKFGLILRLEVTVNDVAFFKQYREVHHRNGERETKWAPMKKTIHSLAPLQDLLRAANHRYLKFISNFETPEVGMHRLNQLTQTRVENQHRYKGFNLLAEEDTSLFRLLLRGEFTISGMTNRALRQLLPDMTSGQISRLLKRLRVHGLIKRVGKRYKYYLTDLGRHVTTTALKLRELYVIPTLAYAPQPAL
jgi:hypothetical protein